MMDSLKDGVSNPAGMTYNQAASQDAFLKGNSLFMPQGIAGLMAYTKGHISFQRGRSDQSRLGAWR